MEAEKQIMRQQTILNTPVRTAPGHPPTANIKVRMFLLIHFFRATFYFCLMLYFLLIFCLQNENGHRTNLENQFNVGLFFPTMILISFLLHFLLVHSSEKSTFPGSWGRWKRWEICCRTSTCTVWSHYTTYANSLTSNSVNLIFSAAAGECWYSHWLC